jgi:hypothetical protein
LSIAGVSIFCTFTLVATVSLLRTGMELVRIFIIKNNRRSFLDVERGSMEDTQAQIELSGGTVYHACVLSKPPKRTRARLRKRFF